MHFKPDIWLLELQQSYVYLGQKRLGRDLEMVGTSSCPLKLRTPNPWSKRCAWFQQATPEKGVCVRTEESTELE